MTAGFPNVPIAPGVPNVLRAVGSIETTVNQIVGLVSNLIGQGQQWFVLSDDDGTEIAKFDSVIQVEPTKNYEIGSYPIEDGSFETYSKVEMPFEGRIALACGGTAEARQAFLTAVSDACGSLDLYSIIGPDCTYDSLNFVRYGLRRSAQEGNGLIIIDLFAKEVRVTAVANYSTAQTASGASEQNQGTVQSEDLPDLPPNPANVANGYGGDGLYGPIPVGDVAREGSPAADAIDSGQTFTPFETAPIPVQYESGPDSPFETAPVPIK